MYCVVVVDVTEVGCFANHLALTLIVGKSQRVEVNVQDGGIVRTNASIGTVTPGGGVNNGISETLIASSSNFCRAEMTIHGALSRRCSVCHTFTAEESSFLGTYALAVQYVGTRGEDRGGRARST